MKNSQKNSIKNAIFGVLSGLIIALALTTLVGENPIHIAGVIFKSAFGSSYDFGLTLFYTTALLLTGLSVQISFRAGLFNLGAEGQLLIGAMATTAYALLFPGTPAFLAPWLAGLCGVFAAAIWGGLAGVLKAWRGSHEVVVTMMLNFIAIGLTNWMILQFFHSQTSQNPETQDLPLNFLFARFDGIAKLFPESSVNLTLLIAIALVFIFDFLFRKSSWGFALSACGENETVAEYSGISVRRQKILALTLSGAIAGLVGWNEVLGNSGKFRMGFSPGFGFLGIAVALLAGRRAWTLIPSAFLFAVLLKGAVDLDMESTFITRDFSQILQAVILFAILFFSAKLGQKREV